VDNAVARWRADAPAAWERLLREDPNATPSHRAEFAHALAEALPGMTPAFVMVERGPELLGGTALMVERRGGLHWIHAMPFMLPGAPLAAAGASELVDAVVANALDERARELELVGGEWVLYRPSGAVPAAAVERVPGESRLMESATLDLAEGTEPLLRAMERNTRQEVAAARAAGVSILEEPAALEEAYSLYTMQARRWPGHRMRPLELLRRLLMGATPAACLFTARDRGALLASVLVLTGAHEWMAWWSGVHRDARRRHAFGLLLWSVAERAAESGARRLNLGGSAGREDISAFKRRLGARLERHPVRWIAPAYAGMAGRAVAALQSRLRAGRARGEEQS
jgi:hypothetical protein